MSGSALISSIPNVHKTAPVHRNGNRLVNESEADSYSKTETRDFRIRASRRPDPYANRHSRHYRQMAPEANPSRHFPTSAIRTDDGTSPSVRTDSATPPKRPRSVPSLSFRRRRLYGQITTRPRSVPCHAPRSVRRRRLYFALISSFTSFAIFLGLRTIPRAYRTSCSAGRNGAILEARGNKYPSASSLVKRSRR